MSQYRLDDLIGYTQAVQIASKATSGSVPSVPLRDTFVALVLVICFCVLGFRLTATFAAIESGQNNSNDNAGGLPPRSRRGIAGRVLPLEIVLLLRQGEHPADNALDVFQGVAAQIGLCDLAQPAWTWYVRVSSSQTCPQIGLR